MSAPIQWGPPGPTSLAFVNCKDKFVRAFNGPIGCGKTTTVFADNAIYIPWMQKRSPRDGWRRIKVTVVAKDYRKLWRGPIPTFRKLIPIVEKDWVGGTNNPALYTFKTRHPVDEGPIEVIFEFVAIGDQDAEEFMRGYESTRFLLMEADIQAPEVLHFAAGRAGRYPPMSDGGPVFAGVDMDFNAPEFGSWMYDWMQKPLKHRALFKAPPAMLKYGPSHYEINPVAENLKNLPEGYYEQQIEGEPDYYIRRMILNKPGYNRHNLPVFEEYDDDVHCAARPLEPDLRLPLGIAFDQDLHPAAAVGQMSLDGQFRVIEELVPEPGTGPSAFGAEVNQLLAQPRYAEFPAAAIVAGCDPQGFYGGDEQSDKLSDREWALKVARVTKLKIRPACANNSLELRIDPLKVRMMERRRDQSPKFLICPVKCPTIRAGLSQGYHYRKVKLATEHGIQYAVAPVKNQYSHPVEAMQYLHLILGGYAQFRDRDESRKQTGPAGRAYTEADGPVAGPYGALAITE